MNDLLAATKGRAAILSRHQSHGGGDLMEASAAIRIGGTSRAAFDFARRAVSTTRSAEIAWIESAGDLGTAALLVPLAGDVANELILITLFFDRPTDDDIVCAEGASRERHTMLVRYFKLWNARQADHSLTKTMEAAFDQSDTGFLLLNANAELLFANAAAQTMLETGEGLRRMRNSISASTLCDSVTLQVALNHAISLNRGQNGATAAPVPMVALTRIGKPPLIAVLLATPIRASSPADAALAMHVNDPSRDIATILVPICRLYRLSPAETKLAVHLAQGLPLAEAAKEMNVRELTARTYMKQIFLKTATNRQTELVVLMLSSAVRMRPSLLRNVLPLAEEVQSMTSAA